MMNVVVKMMNDSVKECLSSKEKLKNCTNRLKAEIAEQNKRWSNLSSQIKEDIQNAHPSCKLHFVGTRFTGIAFQNSDCDIYIDQDGRSYYSVLSQEDQKIILQRLKNPLLYSGFEIDCFLDTASVPILRLVHERTEIDCDISCKSGLAVESSLLIRQLLTSDFRVSWLVIFVRWWMRSNFPPSGRIAKFTSYTTTWLVLFFLMRVQPCILSSVRDMKEGCTPKLIGDWDCAFNRDFKHPIQLQNHICKPRRTLLVHFFKFYMQAGIFDQVVLCPLTASMKPRKQFKDLTLPAAYQAYITFVRQNPEKTLPTETPICLLDPFELSNNIAKDVKPEELKKFQKCCGESYKLCNGF